MTKYIVLFPVVFYNNNLKIAKYLIKRDANSHQLKIGNDTNRMLYVERRYFDLVKYLVNELKCNINEQNKNGQTALYYGIKYGSYNTRSISLRKLSIELSGSSKKSNSVCVCGFLWRNRIS